MSDLANDLQRTLDPHYRIVRELGGGGMSQVFLAVEVALDREVVIKVLPPNLAVGVSTDRFRREMQMVAKLQHPHIVPVLSSGIADGLLYYIMPFIKGESLRARLQRDIAMPVEESARLLREVADALGFAHAQGVVHRDIKPDNVLLSSGHAMVTDFGVAKALGVGDPGQEEGLTSVGMALGTPVYMAPEQAMADPNVNHRADLYALGVMAYEMLAGQPPFVAPTAQALIAAHMTRAPESLRVTRSTVPEAFDDLVQRLLAKRPEDRVQNAAELLPVLDRLSMSSGLLSSATPYMTSGATAAPPRDWASLAAPVGGMLLMLAAAWGIRQSLGLPDWVVVAAIAVVLLCVPLALRITRKRAGAGSSLVAHASSSRGMITAGLVSILGLGAAAGAFIGLRAAGIGPFATLLSAGTLNERDRILVAEFGNTTPDTLLGVALTEALTIDLSQSKVVRLIPPAEIRDGLTRMKRDVKTRLVPEVATELAARENVKVVVAGDVAPFAGGFALSARVLDAQGTTLFATRTTANTASEIIPAVAKLSRTLREEIGESLQSIRATPALEQVSTSSLEALQLYSRAIRSQRAGEEIDRLPLFRQALSLDSTFAMAWRLSLIH
ncbi:MAG: serine/threonine-protein kinase, partial [Gemmatimonas sp.]